MLSSEDLGKFFCWGILIIFFEVFLINCIIFLNIGFERDIEMFF